MRYPGADAPQSYTHEETVKEAAARIEDPGTAGIGASARMGALLHTRDRKFAAANPSSGGSEIGDRRSTEADDASGRLRKPAVCVVTVEPFAEIHRLTPLCS